MNRRVSLVYLAAGIFNKGVAFLTVPVFTRLLSAIDYGAVSTYISWVEILSVALSIALYMAVRNSFLDQPDDTASFLSCIMTFSTLLGVVVLAVVVTVAALVLHLPFLHVVVVASAIVHGAANALLLDYTQYLMMRARYIQRAVFVASPNLIAAVLAVIVIMNTEGDRLLLARILPMMAVSAVFSLFALARAFAEARPNLGSDFLKYGLAISAPLVLHGVSLSVLSQSDRIMITALADVSETAIYSVVYNLGMVATVVTTALEGVWLPWFFRKMRDGDFLGINARSRDYGIGIAWVLASIILVSPEVLRFLAPPDYWPGLLIVPPIVLSNFCIFAYIFYVNVEQIYKKTLYVARNTLAAAALNITLNYVFIPMYGYRAAAFTTLASYGFSWVLHARYARRLNHQVFPASMFIFPLALVGVCVAAFYAMLDIPVGRYLFLIVMTGLLTLKEKDALSRYVFS